MNASQQNERVAKHKELTFSITCGCKWSPSSGIKSPINVRNDEECMRWTVGRLSRWLTGWIVLLPFMWTFRSFSVYNLVIDCLIKPASAWDYGAEWATDNECENRIDRTVRLHVRIVASLTDRAHSTGWSVAFVYWSTGINTFTSTYICKDVHTRRQAHTITGPTTWDSADATSSVLITNGGSRVIGTFNGGHGNDDNSHNKIPPWLRTNVGTLKLVILRKAKSCERHMMMDNVRTVVYTQACEDTQIQNFEICKPGISWSDCIL